MTHYKGTVETLTVWKKNDGYFFEALNKEWFGRGIPLFRAGQPIEWDSGENYIKNAQLAERITQPKETQPLTSDNKDETNTRLACIKAAAEFCSGVDNTETVVRTARQFELYVKNG